MTDDHHPTSGLRRAPAGAFDRHNSDDTDKAILSRRLLVTAIGQLKPFEQSLTVIGAHAVFARVEHVTPNAVMPSTNDADLAVNPKFIAPEPAIIELLSEARLEQAHPDRPGIYGYKDQTGIPQQDRTTIDLIVPAAYAGAGRRAARIVGQKNATTRAEGIEFALYDRSPMIIRPLEETAQEPVEVMVAGCAALLIAKAHKIRDRIQQQHDRPHRLRAKDSTDVGLLMLASDPDEVLETMRSISAEQPDIAEIGVIAADMIVSEYLGDASGLVRADLVEGVEQFAGASAVTKIDPWLIRFDEVSKGWRER